MKSISKYLILILLSPVLWSCASDDTDLGGRPISTIQINENSIQEEYSLNKNEVLTIMPTVSQTIDGKEISYEWEVEHEIYSNEQEFVYPCTKLGTFYCRLIVSNEDGKAFFPFVINVNTPYEEGITLISVDPSGKSMLSFMLHNIDGTEDKFYEGDMFSLNNPEVEFASNVSDIIVTNGSLVLSCQGEGTSSNPATMYYLNAKTLDIENFVELPEYPDFKPVKMFVTTISQAGASYPVLSNDGKMYEFASTEAAVVPSTKFPATYSTRSFGGYDGGSGNNFNFYFWDSEIGLPIMMDRNSNFYVIRDYTKATQRNSITKDDNIFATDNDQDVAIFMPHYQSTELLGGTSMEVYFITKANGSFRRTVYTNGIWSVNPNTGRNVYNIKQTLVDIGKEGEVPFEAGVPLVASNTNKMAFYGIGNKIYMWPYEQNSLSYAELFTEVGSSTSIITAIALSNDQRTLYVASYDPQQGGLNGSCHLVTVNRNAATDDVTVGGITNYNNVSYKPVKIMYKNK